MPIQDILGKKSITWPWLIGIVIAGFLGYWKAGGLTPEVPVNPVEPLPAKIVTVVKLDTLTVYEPVLDVDTFIANAPDTCNEWLTRLRAEIIGLRRMLDSVQATNRPGSLTFADSTYFNAYKLWVWGQFRYPSGEGGILYHWERTPYFYKPRFSVGGHVKFFRAPDLELAMRWKQTNHWFSLTAQPSFAKDGTFKTVMGAGWRLEF